MGTVSSIVDPRDRLHWPISIRVQYPRISQPVFAFQLAPIPLPYPFSRPSVTTKNAMEEYSPHPPSGGRFFQAHVSGQLPVDIFSSTVYPVGSSSLLIGTRQVLQYVRKHQERREMISTSTLRAAALRGQDACQTRAYLRSNVLPYPPKERVKYENPVMMGRRSVFAALPTGFSHCTGNGLTEVVCFFTRISHEEESTSVSTVRSVYHIRNGGVLWVAA